MGGGNVVGKVTLDANQSVIAGSADMQIKELHLERLIPKAKSTKASVGTMQGRARLGGVHGAGRVRVALARPVLAPLVEAQRVSPQTPRRDRPAGGDALAPGDRGSS